MAYTTDLPAAPCTPDRQHSTPPRGPACGPDACTSSMTGPASQTHHGVTVLRHADRCKELFGVNVRDDDEPVGRARQSRQRCRGRGGGTARYWGRDRGGTKSAVQGGCARQYRGGGLRHDRHVLVDDEDVMLPPTNETGLDWWRSRTSHAVPSRATCTHPGEAGHLGRHDVGVGGRLQAAQGGTERAPI